MDERAKLARRKIEKVLAGGHHPDRDAQFRRIAERKAEYSAAEIPCFPRYQGQGTSRATLSQGPRMDATGVQAFDP